MPTNDKFLVEKFNLATVKEYNRIDELQIGRKYKILDLKKITTKYGPTLLAMLEDWFNHEEYGQPFIRETYAVFLPHRYATIMTDEELHNYNALKGLGSKAEEMIEKTKTSVGEMAAEKKAAATALIEAQAKKTGDVLWQSKSNLESTAVDTVTEGKQAAIDGFDKEVEKVEKTVEEGIQETKEATKPVESTTPSEPSSMLDPTKLLGSLDISGGIGTVEKEVEKHIDSALNEVNTVVDTKMKEADELIDQKREEVVKTVQEEATKATSSSAEGFGAVLGKAKGLLNF